MLELNELYDKWIKWTDTFLSRKSQCELDADTAEALIRCAVKPLPSGMGI
jgi:hypothetical protein